MESAEYAPAKFDVYIRWLGKASTGFSALMAALWLFTGCGGIVTGLFSIAQVLLLIVVLWFPLLWRRLKGEPLDNNAAKWAAFASMSVFAVLMLSMIFDSTGKHGCFR